MESHTSNYGNIAIGFETLKNNIDGLKNVGLGNQYLLSNISGFENTAIGADALKDNLSSYNTAVGSGTLITYSSGSNNTAVGKSAIGLNQTGSNNTIIGYEAGFGRGALSQSGNVFIGYKAGFEEEGNNKLYINNDASYPLIYGDFTDGSERLTFNGKVGINNSSSMATLHVNAIDGVVFEGATTGAIPVEG